MRGRYGEMDRERERERGSDQLGDVNYWYNACICFYILIAKKGWREKTQARSAEHSILIHKTLNNKLREMNYTESRDPRRAMSSFRSLNSSSSTSLAFSRQNLSVCTMPHL